MTRVSHGARECGGGRVAPIASASPGAHRETLVLGIPVLRNRIATFSCLAALKHQRSPTQPMQPRTVRSSQSTGVPIVPVTSSTSTGPSTAVQSLPYRYRNPPTPPTQVAVPVFGGTPPEDARDGRWPTPGSRGAYAGRDLRPYRHILLRAMVCTGQGSDGHGERIAAGTDSGDEEAARRWHRGWRRGPASASVGRELVMREAMGHRGGGGPAGYGGHPMAGAGAWRTTMRPVPAAVRAHIGERAGGVRLPLSLLVRAPIAPSSLAMRSRGVPASRRRSRSRRGRVRSGASTAGMARRVALNKKGGLRCEGRPELRYCGYCAVVSRPLSRRTIRRQTLPRLCRSSCR